MTGFDYSRGRQVHLTFFRANPAPSTIRSPAEMSIGCHRADRRCFGWPSCIIGAITLIRIAVLFVTPLQLYPDEAQYWWWAQSPDWGYFSKPPLIAWIIWLTTRLGDPEWAIRLASPLLHAGTALVLFGIGRVAFDARIGFWSALAYATLPGVSYSSGLISTDVPLLFCWAAALYAFLRALDDHGWRWPTLCGVALGIGLLAKYAMIYFVLGAFLAAVLVPRARHLIRSRRGALILLLGLLILSPNLVWNAVNGFPTFVHTEANANWGRAKYDFSSAIWFIFGQLGVFGPLMMAGWMAAICSPRFRDSNHRDSVLLLAAFSAPVLALVIVQIVHLRSECQLGCSCLHRRGALGGRRPLALVERRGRCGSRSA